MMPRPKAKQLVWECVCGHIDHSIAMPEDLGEEKEAEEILSISPAEEEEEKEYDED